MAEVKRTIHGSLVSVNGVGLLIVGDSGSGKSRLCLDVIRRGHKLVADDAISLTRANDRLIGRAPKETAGLLEIHGTGIVDVRREFGLDAFQLESEIRACVELSTEEGVYLSDSLLEFIGRDISFVEPRAVSAIVLEEISNQLRQY